MLNRRARSRIQGSRMACGSRLLRITAVAALAVFAFAACEPLETDGSPRPEPRSTRLPEAEEAIEDLKEEVESNTEELQEYGEEEVEDLVESLNQIERQDLQDSASNIVSRLRDRIRARRGTR